MAERFTTDATAKTGKSERTLQRGTARGVTLGEEALREVMGTALDKPEQLNALGEAVILHAAGMFPFPDSISLLDPGAARGGPFFVRAWTGLRRRPRELH